MNLQVATSFIVGLLIAYLDKDGNALDGTKTYKIHLPPNVPAKDSWSFTN